MADNRNNKDKRRKTRKAPSTESLINRAKEILEEKRKEKKKRKPCDKVFYYDPVTGFRSNKGTYSSQKYTRSKFKRSKTDVQVDYSSDIDEVDEITSIEHEASIDTVSGEMNNALETAKNLLAKWKEKNPKLSQKWSERRSAVIESWESKRPELLESILKSCHAMQNVTFCQLCTDAEALIRCYDCCQKIHLCIDCDKSIHKENPLHDRQAMINGFYQNIPPTVAFNSTCTNLINIERTFPGTNIACAVCNELCKPVASLSDSHVIFVSIKGRFDVQHINYECQNCQKQYSSSSPTVVTQLGYWPGSIKNVNYIFDTNLFTFWNNLKSLVPGVSEAAFLKSLEQYSLKKGRVGIINKVTFATSFKEWKFCQFELDNIRLCDWIKCPGCSEQQHSVHVDGNMKLYRFKTAGMRKRECYYDDVFVAPNEKVDEHIKKIYSNSKNVSSQDNMCGETNWRAAGNKLHKKKNVVETGLEIAGCRHSLAQKSVNMFQGEVYGYAHYMQTNYFIPQNINFFWYDVVCKYWPWLKKHDTKHCDQMKPALSVMHAKAHSWACQSLWGGRWQSGACATTGEEVEQINSHFSKLGSTTKHMLPEGREELLTEHALHWNRRKVEMQASSLAQRYKKTEKKLEKAVEDLNKTLVDLNLTTMVNYVLWKEEVLQVAKEAQALSAKKDISLSEQEECWLRHVLNMQQMPLAYQHLLSAAEKLYGTKKIHSLESETASAASTECQQGEVTVRRKAISYLQRSIESCHNAMAVISTNMDKLADSSKQRTKLRKKISQEKATLKELTSLLCNISDQAFSIEDIEKGSFYWRNGEVEAPIRTKRLVVDKHMEVERFQEELSQIKKEMLSYMNFYTNRVLTSLRLQFTKLENAINNCEEDLSERNDQDSGASECSSIKNRYITTSVNLGVLKGKKSLTLEGISLKN